jgi:hypothetical protein
MSDLQPFAKNLLIFDGPNVRDMGFMFTTRMAVVTLSDGSLWVNSPVSVPFDRLKRITELGPVRFRQHVENRAEPPGPWSTGQERARAARGVGEILLARDVIPVEH